MAKTTCTPGLGAAEDAAFNSPTEAGEPSSGQLVARMLGFLRPVGKTAAIAGIVVILRIMVEIAAVYFLSPAITALSHTMVAERKVGFYTWIMGTSRSAAELRTVLLWMALSQAALSGMIYLRAIWDCKLSMYAVYYMRRMVYDKLQRIGFNVHDKMTSGQLINRALSDLQTVRSFVNMSLLSTLDIMVSIVGYLGLLFFRSPWLVLAAALPAPFWWLAIRSFGRKAQPLYRTQQEASDDLMMALTENVNGVHVVRAFGTEPQEIAKYSALNDTLLNRMFSMIRLQACLTPTLKLIAIAAHIALFVLATWLIEKGKMQVGDLMILGVAMATILGKLQAINSIAEGYQKAIVSARRMFEILDAPESAASKRDGMAFSRGEIAFENVSFGYDPGRPVVKNMSFVIPAGKTTAIIGPTGAGKSTMVSLFARFYEPQSGVIRLDGQDARTLDLADLRRAVGYVFQETFLFTDSVRNNIRYGRSDVNDEMLARAAQAADAEEFIARLPNGYDTLLGERGVLLSGGQRQRLALARALVYDPRILVLDDAMAALDPETEQAVHERIGPLCLDRTVVVIAHRVSTVQRADWVLVVENGQVVQAGTHEDLMSRDGHYRDVVRAQLANDKRDNAPLELPSDMPRAPTAGYVSKERTITS